MSILKKLRSTKNTSIQKNIIYLCLDLSIEGSASYTHVIEISRSLRDYGWNIHLIQSNTKYKNPMLRGLNIIFSQVKVLFALRKNSGVYIRYHPFSFISVFFAKVLNKKIFLEVNGPFDDFYIAWPFFSRFEKFFELLYKFQFENASHIFTVTNGLKDYLVNKFDNLSNITVVSNGVNERIFFKKQHNKFNLPEKTISFCGTFAPWQGIEILLKAIESKRWPKDIYLVLAGDGDLKEKIIHVSKKNSNLIFLGKLKYTDVPYVISHSLYTCLPIVNLKNRSQKGLSPMKFWESLACKTPILSSQVTEMEDLIKEYSIGHIINPNTSQNWINFLLNLPKETIRKKMGETGRSLVVKNFTWRKITAKMIQELERK